jgi:hypothetical protein
MKIFFFKYVAYILILEGFIFSYAISDFFCYSCFFLIISCIFVVLKYRDLRELCDFLGYTSIFMTFLRFTKRIIALIEFKVKSFFFKEVAIKKLNCLF